jgi:hypothetical protein
MVITQFLKAIIERRTVQMHPPYPKPSTFLPPNDATWWETFYE